MLTLGSLFDGIGGWLLAAQHAGVEPVWASEIEPFPAAVTAHHFPNVVQLGDITKIKDLWPVDIVTAGSPCQNLSLAGNRKGLRGERSGLFFRAVELVRRLRMSTGGRYPRFFVFENVPGLFTSNQGFDFRAVLEEIGQTSIPMPEGCKWANAGLAELPECQIAWRVLDAQHALPQRRRRIFLVADFGGKAAGEILLVGGGLRGRATESRDTRERFAVRVQRSVDTAVVRIRAGKDGGGKGALVSYEMSLTLATSNDQILFTKLQDKTAKKTVRRLTPIEVERLQGLPYSYTLIDDKTCSDTARYKALGNGMAAPCAEYVVRRIVEVTT